MKSLLKFIIGILLTVAFQSPCMGQVGPDLGYSYSEEELQQIKGSGGSLSFADQQAEQNSNDNEADNEAGGSNWIYDYKYENDRDKPSESWNTTDITSTINGAIQSGQFASGLLVRYLQNAYPGASEFIAFGGLLANYLITPGGRMYYLATLNWTWFRTTTKIGYNLETGECSSSTSTPESKDIHVYSGFKFTSLGGDKYITLLDDRKRVYNFYFCGGYIDEFDDAG